MSRQRLSTPDSHSSQFYFFVLTAHHLYYCQNEKNTILKLFRPEGGIVGGKSFDKNLIHSDKQRIKFCSEGFCYDN